MPRQPTKPDEARDAAAGGPGHAGDPLPDTGHGEEAATGPPAEAPPAPPPPGPGAAAPPFQIGERLFTVGMTGKGKSEILLSCFANWRGQRLLIDVQDHYTLGPAALAEEPPPLECDRPAAIDWRHRTIRYVVRRPGDRREMDQLHAAIYNRGNLFVACDEAEDVAPSLGAGAPFFVKKCLKQGRKRRITYGSASQRPFGVDRSLTMQAEHACVFPMVDEDDLRVMARRLGMSVDELARTLDALGPFEYLRHTVGSRQVLHMPPLPPSAVTFTRRHVINPEFTARA